MVYSDDAERSVSLQKRNHLKAKIMAESGTKEHGGHKVRTGSRERAGEGAQVRRIHRTPWSATGASLIDTPVNHTLTKSFTLLGASNPPSLYLTFLFGKIGAQYYLL